MSDATKIILFWLAFIALIVLWVSLDGPSCYKWVEHADGSRFCEVRQ